MTGQDWLQYVAPIVTAAGAVLVGYWKIIERANREERARRSRESVRMEERRMDSGDTANDRLFKRLDDEVKILRGECQECREGREEDQNRISELREMVVRLTVRDEAMRDVIIKAGLTVPPMPLLGVLRIDRDAALDLDAPRG